jgi:glycerol-3-phosphate acyltransferase PlsY
MIDLLVKVLLAYMLGSVSGSMVVGAFRHVDIRDSGSGNAGGTNAFRTQGFAFALCVVIIDIGKGFLATWLFPQMELAVLGDPASQGLLVLSCGFAAVVGHCYPIWYGFRGGKGAATAVGALLVIEPMALIPTFIWLDPAGERLWFSVLLALFVIFTHRSNIANMINGTEYRFERIRIRNWFR